MIKYLEVKRLWQLRSTVKVIPIVVRELGRIPKLEFYVEKGGMNGGFSGSALEGSIALDGYNTSASVWGGCWCVRMVCTMLVE